MLVVNESPIFALKIHDIRAYFFRKQTILLILFYLSILKNSILFAAPRVICRYIRHPPFPSEKVRCLWMFTQVLIMSDRN